LAVGGTPVPLLWRGTKGAFRRSRKLTRLAQKKDVKNEDWSHNVIENKGPLFNRELLAINLYVNKLFVYL
jgi:hypothetical protein